LHLLDAVLESVMVFRLAAEVVVPLGLAKAGFLSGCTVVLGIVAATEERSILYHRSTRTVGLFWIQYHIIVSYYGTYVPYFIFQMKKKLLLCCA
jgi:hypothetical protein